MSKKPTTIGAMLAAMRRIEKHECLNCRKEFTGIKTAKFCSNKCRFDWAYRKRKQATRKEA